MKRWLFVVVAWLVVWETPLAVENSLSEAQLETVEDEAGAEYGVIDDGLAIDCKIPGGIQHNFPISKLGGWERCYFEPYSTKTTAAKLLAKCTVGKDFDWFVGGTETKGSKTVFLGAFVPSTIATKNTVSKVEATNVVKVGGGPDVYFYNVKTWSFGFSNVPKVKLSSCDVATPAKDRLCWHMKGIHGGYSLGKYRGLNVNSGGKYKVIYQRKCGGGGSPPGGLIRHYNCPPGSHLLSKDARGCICQMCPYGYFCVGGITKPQKCKAGTYQSHMGQKDCTDASPGHHARGGANRYQKWCEFGYYQPDSGKAECIAASAGHHVNNRAGTVQVECQPGSCQNRKGQRFCVQARKGHFVPGVGAIRDTKCNYGTFSSIRGATVCKQASRGNYVPGTGYAIERKCPVNNYQDAIGQMNCIPCEHGFTQPHEGKHYCLRK